MVLMRRRVWRGVDGGGDEAADADGGVAWMSGRIRRRRV